MTLELDDNFTQNNVFSLKCATNEECIIKLKSTQDNTSKIKELDKKLVDVLINVGGHPRIKLHGSSLIRIDSLNASTFMPLGFSKACLAATVCPGSL